MGLTWTDELSRTWTVELDVPEVSPDLEMGGGGDAVLVFSREGGEARVIDVLGPMEAYLEELDDAALQHALEAASTGVGLLLVDDEGTVWWVHGPDAEARGGSWAVKFSDGEREYTHDGPLTDDLERVSEDELLELLDDARGRLMDPLDLRV